MAPVLTSTQPDVDELLSRALSRRVSLASTAFEQPVLEEYWPDLEEFSQRNTVTDEAYTGGAFFDGAPIHLLTTATLDRLRGVYPQGRLRPAGFGPNYRGARGRRHGGIFGGRLGRSHGNDRR